MKTILYVWMDNTQCLKVQRKKPNNEMEKTQQQQQQIVLKMYLLEWMQKITK